MNQQKKWVTKVVADKIRHLRKQKDISQEALALRAGINTVYYGQIERGQKCPTVDTLYKIASGLKVPLPELLRFDMPSAEADDMGGYIERLIKRIPPNKTAQVIKILEDIINLL